MRRIFAFIFLLLASTIIVIAQDCELKKDKGGVKVYACFQDTSKFKLLKAEFLIENTTYDELRSFLMDVPNYPTWQYNMEEVQFLKRIDENSFIIRSVTNAPWPVTDREMIVQFTSIEDKASNVMTFKVQTVPFKHPKNDNLVRVPFSDAKWTVKQDSNKNLSVLYTLNIDPGGSIPAWLVNMAIAEGPYESFSKLKNQLAKKYNKK